MTTIADIVLGAFKATKAVHEGATLTAHQQAEGIRIFNELMHGLEGRGLSFKDSAGVAFSFADKTGSDAFPIAEKHRSPVQYLLAVRIADAFGYEITQVVGDLSRSGFAQLYADFGARSEAAADTILTRQVRYGF